MLKNKINIKREPKLINPGSLFMVEMAGVEPASENLFLKLSTSVVYLL